VKKPPAVLGLWLSLCLIALAPAAGRGSGKTYPVAAVGDIDAALEQASPGDRIVMKNGLWANARIRFRAMGTADAPIRLSAETPGRVILTGSSSLSLGGSHLVVEGLLFQDTAPTAEKAEAVISFRTDSRTQAQDCRVTDCAIIDFSPPDKKVDTRWVSLYGLRNRVDHCAFHNKTNLGTTLVVWLNKPAEHQPNYHRIDHNYFGPRTPVGMNGAETIRIGDSATSMQVSRTTVESNYFYRCNGEGEIISNKSCENVYRGNTFVECEGALTLRHGNRSTVEGNFFLGNGARLTGGVRVIGEDQRVVNNYFADLAGDDSRSALTFMEGIKDSPLSGYFQVKNALVAFNTFVNNKHNFNFGEGAGRDRQTMPPVRCKVANNLVVGKTAPLVVVHDPAAEIRFEGNLMYGAELGIPPCPGIRQLDPRLEKGSDGLWRPAPDSPALGAAEGSFFNVSEDMDGQKRTGKLDVGADQRSNEPIQCRPLTPKDVGPSWPTLP